MRKTSTKISKLYLWIGIGNPEKILLIINENYIENYVYKKIDAKVLYLAKSSYKPKFSLSYRIKLFDQYIVDWNGVSGKVFLNLNRGYLEKKGKLVSRFERRTWVLSIKPLFEEKEREREWDLTCTTGWYSFIGPNIIPCRLSLWKSQNQMYEGKNSRKVYLNVWWIHGNYWTISCCRISHNRTSYLFLPWYFLSYWGLGFESPLLLNCLWLNNNFAYSFHDSEKTTM